MTAYNKATIKTYFQTGDRPTQSNFEDLIDSYIDTSAAGTVGALILATNTTAAAQNAIGGSTIGLQLFNAATTAAATAPLGLGVLAFQATVSATNMQNNSVSYAAISSAAFATSAQAISATPDKAMNASVTSVFMAHPWVAYTPTLSGFGTASNVSFFSRRVGDSLEVRGRFTSGTPTATEARITFGYNGTSGNVTSDNAKLPSGVASVAGAAATTNAGTGLALTCLIEGAISYLTLGIQAVAAGALTKTNADNIVTAGQSISVFANIPISGW